MDDWLVAGSEDEGTFTQWQTENSLDAKTPATLRDDQISADKSLFTPSPPGMDSSSVPLTSGEPPAVVPKPRPRPRLVMKKAVVPDTSFSHISDAPISTTKQTNDSIQPASTTSIGFSDSIDDLYSSFGIAERAKMRSRKPQAAKKSMPPPAQMNDVIELTSDEDELALKPTKRQKKQGDTVTKSRPKPRLKVKAAALPCDSPPTPAVIPDPPAHPASSSQPPASTFPTIPPSTPPQVREPSPASSPPITTRKRKRIPSSIAEDDDEMNLCGGNPTPSSAMPPPFFAPSSSSIPTDSGVELPPAESLSGRGKKKQASSKSRVRGKAQKKGKGASVADEMPEEPPGLSQHSLAPATHHSSTPGCHSPAARKSVVTKKASKKQAVTKKGKVRIVDSCDEEDELILPSKSNAHTPPADEAEDPRTKENLRPDDLSSPKRDSAFKHTPTSGVQIRGSPAKSKMTPMSELIRRVNSQPCSPFPNASRTYSPFLKSSRTMLSRIAPLHPNRRTPPPPLPRPPPPKKSKKQLEMEERIEEELAETVDGWSCLTDDERKALRKARIDAELGYE